MQVMLQHNCPEYPLEISPGPAAAATSPAGPTQALGSAGSPSPAYPTTLSFNCSELPDEQILPLPTLLPNTQIPLTRASHSKR